MNRIRISLAALGLMGGLFGVVGCEKVGGGASVKVDVTFVPPNFGLDAGDTGESETNDSASGAEAATGSGPGKLVGKVVLTGTLPALPFPPMFTAGSAIKDAEVCAAVDTPDERLEVGEGNGVRNVFIYLKKTPKGDFSLNTEEAVIFDQKNCRFKPHCMIIPVGATVKVLSDDAVTHNTHTYPTKSTGVSNTVNPNDREGAMQYSFKRAEPAPIRVTCDFHAWMVAWQLPVDHPFASVTDENGNFEIPDLPAGKHEFLVWHEGADGGFVSRGLSVTIAAGVDNPVTIDYPASQLAAK
ncbi:MAG: hypothetical protein KDA85_11695 [Planctomycetaceae bacterium]|nr:hypothetical protein [Planctomycetaceae bacterium]